MKLHRVATVFQPFLSKQTIRGRNFRIGRVKNLYQPVEVQVSQIPFPKGYRDVWHLHGAVPPLRPSSAFALCAKQTEGKFAAVVFSDNVTQKRRKQRVLLVVRLIH